MNLFKSLLAFATSVIVLVSCTKNNDRTIACTQSIPPVHLIFNVLGTNSGQDLFFSTSPSFGLRDIYFFKTKDVLRKDTIRPTVDGIGATRNFRLTVDNTKLKDTLLMKIGNETEDKLIVNLKLNDAVCPIPVIDKLHLNELELPPSQGKYIIRK